MSTYEISKSSLLSLKAEILRKHDDLNKARSENEEKIKVIKKKTLEFKNKGVSERELNDLDDEEKDLLKLSRSRLEAKSKLYEKLSQTGTQSEEIKRRFLVRFDQKAKHYENGSLDNPEEYDLPVDSEEEEAHNSDYYDEDVDPSEQWVEYTDCLGRTRKCLRKDLDQIKSRDAELRHLAVERDQGPKQTEEHKPEPILIEEKEEDPPEKQPEDIEREMVSGEMRRDMLRKQWEKEEEELRNRSDVHYQNVLFDEARQHGVGYYGFSKDEEERAKQQEALNKLRTETEQQQMKAQELKALREKQMAARMRAAKNRKRARLGLPPEEDEPEPTPKPTQDVEEDKQKKEELQKQQEIEKKLEEVRKRHVRPWDIGKDGIKEHYEMSQHEWNDKKRRERPAEFAPPISYSKREFNSMKTIECDVEDGNKSLKFTSKSKKLKPTNINPYKESDCSDLYKPEKPISIINELEPDCAVSQEKQRTRKGAEIAPPSSYGNDKNKIGQRPEKINIEASIEAGLRFLRAQSEKKKRQFDESDL